jgi:hypothetical protein
MAEITVKQKRAQRVKAFIAGCFAKAGNKAHAPPAKLQATGPLLDKRAKPAGTTKSVVSDFYIIKFEKYKEAAGVVNRFLALVAAVLFRLPALYFKSTPPTK